MKVQLLLLGISIFQSLGPAQSQLPDSNSLMPSCIQLSSQRPHIRCCEDSMVFCEIQCNQGLCRCVEPATGNLVGSGVFFNREDNPNIDCIDIFPVEPTSPPVTTAPTEPETTTEAPIEPETTTEAPTEPETTTEALAEPETTTEAPTEPETTTEALAEPETTTEALAEPETTTEALAEPETTTEALAEPETTTETLAEPETTTETLAEPETTTDKEDESDSSRSGTSRSGTSGRSGTSSRSRCDTVTYLQEKGCNETCITEDDDGCPACMSNCHETTPTGCASCNKNQVCLRVGRFGQRTCVDALINGERCDGESDDDSDEEDSSDHSKGRKKKKEKARRKIKGAKDRRIFGALSEATPPCADGLVCTRVSIGMRECRPENVGGVCVVARETSPELECAADGSYRALQCSSEQGSSNKICVCVQPDSGSVLPGTEVSVTDLEDAPDCDDQVFKDCSVLSGGQIFTIPHGEYFIDVANCKRCFCDNGVATFCKTSVCSALSTNVQDTRCEYNGQSYRHGDTFDINCSKCGCSRGILECTHTPCAGQGIGDQCDTCKDEPLKHVCTPNGKTFQSPCAAIYCGGYAPFDLWDGPCADYDICKLYPCAEGQQCLKKGGISCFDPDGCEPDELRFCVDLSSLVCDDVSAESGDQDDSEDDGEDTSVCGTNGQTYPSLCRLLQDTGNEGVAYVGDCEREECDGGPVCGTDRVTYKNICVLRSQSGNARMDYRGECDVDKEDPQETPEGVCERVSRVRRCAYNISNCNRLVKPEEGCCALCGGIVFIAIDFRGIGEYVKINPSMRTIDDFIEHLIESGFITEEITSRCEIGGSMTKSGNLQVTLEALTSDDEVFCSEASDTFASWINDPNLASRMDRPQVLEFASAAVSGQPLVQELIGSPNGVPPLRSLFALIAMCIVLILVVG